MKRLNRYGGVGGLGGVGVWGGCGATQVGFGWVGGCVPPRSPKLDPVLVGFFIQSNIPF